MSLIQKSSKKTLIVHLLLRSIILHYYVLIILFPYYIYYIESIGLEGYVNVWNEQYILIYFTIVGIEA